MKWRSGKRSDNLIDQRGQKSTGKAGGKLSLTGIAIVMVIGLMLGQNPLEMLGLVAQLENQSTTTQQQHTPIHDEASEFVSHILGETEVVWTQEFQQIGKRYQAPKLVLFSGSVTSACGYASAAVGPFYCPGDHRAYLDTSFFAEMRRKLGGGGDFAYAYVIAHEVGHHVQTLLGVSEKVNNARRAGQRIEGDHGLLVRQELQADCYAGIWAHHSERRLGWMDDGDIEQALSTAAAIGDDRLQKQAQGAIVPDAFTHGTSEQRIRWFKKGFSSGDMQQCDTFAAKAL